ncbi:MAG: RHS repeat domain-containing protein, partial [Pseudomonadota bacterium]
RNGPSVAVSLIYDHDANGRITSIVDSVNPGWNRSFGYDDLGRLTSASGPWGSTGGWGPG